MKHVVVTVFAVATLMIAGCNGGGSSNAPTTAQVAELAATSVAKASCGPDDKPETALQGQVPLAERTNGRSTQGYNCNLVRLGQFQGEGATWVSPSYKNCAYMATAFSGNLQKKLPGVQVIDVADVNHPRFVKSLDSAAFKQGTWESLKVNEPRGLLAGVAVGPIEDVAFFDIYDIGADCTKPVLKNPLIGTLTVPSNLVGHEGNFSPDGKTYWATSSAGGIITAIDVSNPVSPRIVYVGNSLLPNHGFDFSPDGNRMYLASSAPAGILILDVSDVQRRAPIPVVKSVSTILWLDGAISQHAIPVSYNGKPYLIAVDEFGSGATRIIDISDEKKPVILSKLRLEIQQPEHADQRRQDLSNNGTFGYEGHYCDVDSRVNPTALACGYFQSGVRVFDIRNPLRPTEIAYYNPPAQTGENAQLPGSEHAASIAGSGPGLSDIQNGSTGIPTKLTPKGDLNTDWCSSPPRFVGNQLWVTCQDNGFMVLELTNNVYPLSRPSQ